MKEYAGEVYDDVRRIVDETINYIGKDITFAMPLALGKPIIYINELYRRAKEDPTIKLRIVTALALEKPRGHTELEKRFLKPLSDRVFDGVIDFDYMLDMREHKLPDNVEVYEFFSKAGAYLHDPEAQQNHLNSNYTHVVRDAVEFGVNVFGQMASYQEINGKMMYSMGCNTDIAIEAIQELGKLRKNGTRKIVLIAEANQKLPFMYGDAVVDPETYDMILQGPAVNYELFAPPKDAVAIPDHMIGINVSTLVRDGGTIQVGIGSLGDAIVAGLEMRNEHNDVYKEFINKVGITKRYESLITRWGDIGLFHKGLYGSSEMFVDAFMQMYKSKILKRKVFDNLPLMKLINEGKLDPESIPQDIIDQLSDMKAVQTKLTEEDFAFLSEFGILKPGLAYNDGMITDGADTYSTDMNEPDNRVKIRKLLGSKLQNGQVILGAFYIGPKSFYNALNEMSDEERKQFGMSGVEKVNQLYGNEELRSLQRRDGRFVNAGMVCNLLGAIASDQLEDGRVISGIGGQYNFVSMAHALPDGRLIMMIRSTKGSGAHLRSNIVWNYGHCSVPKHLRDIIVTEYGIADVRGKADKEVIAQILNITDSRFQEDLLQQAKKAGKIPMDYQIPEEYRHNTPEKLAALIKPYQEKGYFKPFPFGTDLTPTEVILGGALKGFKALATGSRGRLLSAVLSEMFKPIPESSQIYLERMGLAAPDSMKEKLFRKLIILSLRRAGRL